MTVSKGRGTTRYDYVTLMPTIPVTGITVGDIIVFAEELAKSGIPRNTPVTVTAGTHTGRGNGMYARYRRVEGDPEPEVPEVPEVLPVSGTSCYQHLSFRAYCSSCISATAATATATATRIARNGG